MIIVDGDADDDEWGDAWGDVDAGMHARYPGTRLAAIAVIDAAARAAGRRADGSAAVRAELDALARRGARRVAEQLDAQLDALGSAAFDATLRAAADAIATRVRAAPITPAVADALDRLGSAAFVPGFAPAPRDADALLDHLGLGATLAIDEPWLDDAGHPYEPPPPARLTLVLAVLPRLADAATVVPIARARTGDGATEIAVELRVAIAGLPIVLRYRGRPVADGVAIDGPAASLLLALDGDGGAVTFRPGPAPTRPDDGGALLRAVLADDVAGEVLARIMTIEGDLPPALLRRLLVLAPRLAPHRAAVASFLATLRGARGTDPMMDIMAPLETFLRDRERA